MKTEKTSLSAPWITYQRMLEVLFKDDPDIKVVINYDKDTVSLYVENTTKAEALMELLPDVKDINGHIIYIDIIPANDIKTPTYKLFKQAFDGNPIFNNVFTVDGGYTNPVVYAMFEDKVAQFWNDNLGDPHGNVSMLYQDVAKYVFDDIEGINYCTVPVRK